MFQMPTSSVMMTRMLGLTPVAWASDALEKSADAAIRSGVRLRMAVRFNVAILRETWTTSEG
jgi:hypothetical protein